ncbi:MAG: 2-amino-4-hydroxy-6-hydroxymethyldihydropteridine diphosphokinase, partial [Calditrichaeota bacterium]
EMKPRPIDLDILLFGEQMIKSENLIIPHKELLNRAFAMIPLLQITPEIVHPEAKRAIADFVREADKSKVVLYKDHVARNI